MPLYEYKCSQCEEHLEELQKMSDAPLTVCPKCKKKTLVKQITSTNFQLKGNGYYVTDFKNGNSSSLPRKL